MANEIANLKSQGKLKRIMASIGGGDNQTFLADLNVSVDVAA
jgi:hypothetical protein